MKVDIPDYLGDILRIIEEVGKLPVLSVESQVETAILRYLYEMPSLAGAPRKEIARKLERKLAEAKVQLEFKKNSERAEGDENVLGDWEIDSIL